jgi:fumarate reductase iron-sulfur subunit
LNGWNFQVEGALKMKNEPVNRRPKISILRFNPWESGSVPRRVTYELDEAENMTLFIALNEIRERQEPSLEFDFVCRAGICGMMINGRPTLACRMLTRDLDAEISLHRSPCSS